MSETIGHIGKVYPKKFLASFIILLIGTTFYYFMLYQYSIKNYVHYILLASLIVSLILSSVKISKYGDYLDNILVQEEIKYFVNSFLLGLIMGFISSIFVFLVIYYKFRLGIFETILNMSSVISIVIIASMISTYYDLQL